MRHLVLIALLASVTLACRDSAIPADPAFSSEASDQAHLDLRVERAGHAAAGYWAMTPSRFLSLASSLSSCCDSSVNTAYDCAVGRPSAEATTPISAPILLLRRIG